ncbi:hypothetical protein [Chondromyces crocatus]|uniref:Uncharacterized protein n=1 Tax=Chondromyces crocatus TaxID=52 RepID=A0A0K1EQ95_CHOCO|nr:hypothetical protein [Chondromyces crocatus]AKT43021.1 uncharacterized protein CMC5_072480 [Chondromyces crocatus]
MEDQADQTVGNQATSPGSDRTGSPEPGTATTRATQGPDPVIGAGVTLLGIFLMGIGGAGDMHYFFNVGTLVAVTGAILFVLFVTWTALRQRPPERTKSEP